MSSVLECVLRLARTEPLNFFLVQLGKGFFVMRPTMEDWKRSLLLHSLLSLTLSSHYIAMRPGPCGPQGCTAIAQMNTRSRPDGCSADNNVDYG